jgi:O-antigen/teichoic acid export membrane protein
LRFSLPGQHSSTWILAESVASAVLSFASMLFVARIIGPEAAGAGTVALAAYQLPELLASSLFSDALVQRRDLRRQHVESAAAATILVSLAAAAVLAMVAPLLAYAAGDARIAWLVISLAPLMPLTAYMGISQALQLRQRRYRLLAMRILVGQPIGLCIAIAVGTQGLGPWAIVAGQIVATATAFLVALTFGAIGPCRRLDRSALAELWPIAAPQAVSTIINVGKYRLFLVALGLVASGAVLAQAHFAFRMLDAALTVVWQVMTRLALPRLCGASEHAHDLAEGFGELTQLQALLGFPIAVGVALVAPEMVQALLGPAWANTAQAAQVAGLTAAVVFISGPYTSLFVAIGRPSWNLRSAAATLLLPLAALLVLRPSTPAEIAWAWSVQCLILPPLIIRASLHKLRRNSRWMISWLLPPVLATAAMAGAVLCFKHYANLPPLLSVIGQAAIGAVSFGAVIWPLLGLRLPAALVWKEREEVL